MNQNISEKNYSILINTFSYDYSNCSGGTSSFCNNKYTKRYGRCEVCLCKPPLIDKSILKFIKF